MAETVDLRIPPRPEYISVARLTVAALAARQAFPYDEIEDLKVAVSEACNVLIGSRRGSKDPIALHFAEEGDVLDIRIETQRSGVDPRAFFPDPGTARRRAKAEVARALGVFLIQCLVDEVRRIDGDGSIELRLRKKRRENTNGSPSAAE